MKAFTVFAAAVLTGTALIAAEDHLIGHWDFADAKEAAVPGKVGPAGNIKRYGTSAEIVQRNGKTMLKITGKYEGRNNSGCFSVPKMTLDPTKPFTVICDFYFDEEISHRDTREFLSVSDGEKGPGFRVFYSWGTLKIRTGDGKNVQQVSSKGTAGFRMPCGRMAQLAVVYDGKTAALYVDGQKIAEQEFTIQPCKNRNLCFGSIGYGFAYPLNGALGNIRVYDKALSAQEVAEKYLAEREAQE